MITVNALGDVCPTPVIKTKKVIDKIQGSETVEVLVDNEIAVTNVSKFGQEAGGEVSTEKKSDKEYHVRIVLPADRDAAKAEAKEQEFKPECGRSAEHSIVVIDSATMGTGDDELGGILMKGFIYAVSQLDQLPEKIIFYNGGAKITGTESASINDLKQMEQDGVEVMTCGTCLEYYGLKDTLQVGSVTNMYSIVEAMDQADKIMKP